MANLVICSWKVGQTPVDKENNFVVIVARRSGILYWLLTIVNASPTSSIKMGGNRMEFTTSSLAGSERRIIPLENICSTYYGYYKPIWKALGLFVLLVVMTWNVVQFLDQYGVGKGWIVLSQVAGILLTLVVPPVYYFLNRAFTLGVVETSGVINGIRFKRSVIENEDVDETKAAFASEMMQALIEAKHYRYMPAAK